MSLTVKKKLKPNLGGRHPLVEWLGHRIPVREVLESDTTTQPRGRYLQGSILRAAYGTSRALWGLIVATGSGFMCHAIWLHQIELVQQ